VEKKQDWGSLQGTKDQTLAELLERLRVVGWLFFCKVIEMRVLASLGSLAPYGLALGPTDLGPPL